MDILVLVQGASFRKVSHCTSIFPKKDTMKSSLALQGTVALFLGLEVAAAACISSTIDYWMTELARTDLDETVTYNFCPDTEVKLSPQEPAIVIFNPNVRLVCGDDGKSSDNCIINNAATGGEPSPSIFLSKWSDIKDDIVASLPPGMEPNFPDADLSGFEVQGMTFTGGSGGYILAYGVKSDIVLKNCVFTVSIRSVSNSRL